MSDTDLMTIPGQFDPVPAPREITPRADGKVDLLGLTKTRIHELFADAGTRCKTSKTAR